MKHLSLKTFTVFTAVLGAGSAVITANSTGAPAAPMATPPSPQAAGASPSKEGVPQTDTAPNPPPATSAAYEDTRGRPASALIGRDVMGEADVKLGRLDDFVVDADSGKIIYAVVSSAGTKGPGGGLRAVPFPALIPELAEGGLRMRLNVEDAAWAKAPRFEKDQLVRLSEEDGLLRQDTYRVFGLQPPLNTRPGEQKLVLVREVIGKQLHRGEQSIGKIEDVIVHLNTHMAAVLLDPRDDFVGTDQKFILPFSRIIRTEGNALGTTLSAQEFTSAQTSTDATWADSTSLFTTPYLWPPYGASATPLANTSPTVLNRGLSATRPPVEEIRQALAADVHTRDAGITVLAAHDRVILTGTVQDGDDKRRVENRVSQAAGGWKIDNQIRIAGTIAP